MRNIVFFHKLVVFINIPQFQHRVCREITLEYLFYIFIFKYLYIFHINIYKMPFSNHPKSILI